MISLFSMACLGDAGVASIMAGQSPSSKTYNIVGDGLPFFQGKADFGYTYPVPRIWCNQPHKIAKRGDILISVRAPVGDVNIADRDCAIGRGLAAIRAENSVDIDFLFFSLKHVRQKLIDNSTGSTFSNINISTLQDIEIPFPDKKIRYQIGILLQYIYKNIEYEFNLYTKVQTLKNTVMHKLFTCGLRGEAQKETEIGLVPNGWKIVPLSSLGKIGNGSTPKKTINKYWEQGYFPWLTSSKVYDRDIVSAEQFVSKIALDECHLPIIKPGAILIAITGQGKTLGHCAVLNIEATINQHLAYIQVDLIKAMPSFVRGYLETQYEYLRQVASAGGSTKGALTCAFLSSLAIPLPDMEEQQEIVDILDAIDRKIDLHRRKKAVLEELFKSLLHKLMTGEIRVDELDLSALEALQQPGGAA